MCAVQVILANEPRLLRGMLGRVIRQIHGLEIAGEVTDLTQLPSVIEQSGAHWVIVSIWPAGEMPPMIEGILARYHSVRVLGMAADGSEAKLIGAGLPEKALTGLSLDDLIATLRRRQLESPVGSGRASKLNL
jgi:hypothetical protein